MFEYIGGYRCVRIWDDTDVQGHGRMQIFEDMVGYRCVRTWDNVDV